MTEFIICFAIVCAAVAIYIFLISPSTESADSFPKSLLTPYAHRGLHNETLPENSTGAFKEASAHGYGIELDVQLSSDGEVMIFHDATLKRVCGIEKKLSDLSAKDLSKTCLFDSEYTIPRFSEVLELIDGSVPLLVELKGESGDTKLCDKVFELLDTYNGPFCIESFNPLLLSYVRKKRPSYIRGQLVSILSKDDYKGSAAVRFMLSHMLLNVISRPHFIAFNAKKNPRIGIKLTCDLLGAKKFVWTPRSYEDYLRLKSDGIVSIFENFKPGEAQK